MLAHPAEAEAKVIACWQGIGQDYAGSIGRTNIGDGQGVGEGLTGDCGIRAIGFGDDEISLHQDGSEGGIAVVAESRVSFIAGNSNGIGLVSSGRSIDRDHNGPLEATAHCQPTDGAGNDAASVGTASRSRGESDSR